MRFVRKRQKEKIEMWWKEKERKKEREGERERKAMEWGESHRKIVNRRTERVRE